MTEPAMKGLIHRGWIVLFVMVALAVATASEAYVRNMENRRLNDCVRDVISTIGVRSAFTAQLDDQDEADRAATDRFWVGIAGTSNAGKRQVVFDQYQRDRSAIQTRRDAVLRERNAHKFPSLAQCQ